MLFAKLRAQVGYRIARKLFNQRWAVENPRVWQWMQERFARMSRYDDVAARAFYGHVLLHRGQGLRLKMKVCAYCVWRQKQGMQNQPTNLACMP